jgi:hypothetical protein
VVIALSPYVRVVRRIFAVRSRPGRLIFFTPGKPGQSRLCSKKRPLRTPLCIYFAEQTTKRKTTGGFHQPGA